MEHIILLVFTFFIEAVILWQYTSSLFSLCYNTKIRLALLSIFYTILFLLSLPGQTWLNIFSFFIINTIFLYILFKLKLLIVLILLIFIQNLRTKNLFLMNFSLMTILILMMTGMNPVFQCPALY